MHVEIAMMAGWAVTPAVGYGLGRLLIARQKRRIDETVARTRVQVPLGTAASSIATSSNLP